jgi:hypothetical protein
MFRSAVSTSVMPVKLNVLNYRQYCRPAHSPPSLKFLTSRVISNQDKLNIAVNSRFEEIPAFEKKKYLRQ